MDQISPRFFEMMIHSTIPLVNGNFLPDDFKPYENFIPFDFDKKNLDDVFKMVNDQTYQKKIVLNNIEYLRNGKNNYKTFMKSVEFEIRKCIKYKNTRKIFSNIYRTIPSIDWSVHPNEKNYNLNVSKGFDYLLRKHRQIYNNIDPFKSPTSEPIYYLEANLLKDYYDDVFKESKNDNYEKKSELNKKVNINISFFNFNKNLTLIRHFGFRAKNYGCSKIFYFLYLICKFIFPKFIKKIIRKLI